MKHSLKHLIASLFFVLFLSGCGINALPTYEENAKAKWADVQAQYQRRADLVPNLVSAVKGYAKQERDVLSEVTKARASATQVKVDASTVSDPEAFARFQQAQGQLGGVLGRLMAISEQYPDLKSSASFLSLQSQLEGTENRIAIARRDYNEAVRVYNTQMKTIPGKWIAAWLYPEAKPMEMFAASTPGADTAPAVTF